MVAGITASALLALGFSALRCAPERPPGPHALNTAPKKKKPAGQAARRVETQ
jgi:hypothetical protein